MHLYKWYFMQAQALAVVAANPHHLRSTSSIEWGKCPDHLVKPDGVARDCGSISVPLDYSNKTSEEKLQLTLLRVKAIRQPVKGTILINPGGPGEDGFLELSGWKGPYPELELNMTGGHYNLIGYQYRGIGDTLPVSCYNMTDPAQFNERAKLNTLTTARMNQSAVVGEQWTLQKMYAGRCEENAKRNASLISTAFTARDMMQIVDALGEDGLLRYWGQSYGTFLGATLAAMFPDRIERMVLDGNVNPHEFAEGWEYEMVSASDRALEQFLKDCLQAGRDKCALAAEGVTVQNLTTRIHNLYKTVEFEPIAMGNNVSTDLVGRNQISDVLAVGLRGSFIYAAAIATYFNAVFERNYTAYHEALLNLQLTSTPETDAIRLDSVYGIRCADAGFRTSKLSDITPRVAKLQNQSYLFADQYAATYMACSEWIKAKERYDGNFNAKTKHPLMFIGSPYDNRTPLISAQNASAGFEGSVVLQHNGIGHTVIYSPGKCAVRAIQNYFNTGNLPELGTICEPDRNVFSNAGKDISISELWGDSFYLE